MDFPELSVMSGLVFGGGIPQIGITDKSYSFGWGGYLQKDSTCDTMMSFIKAEDCPSILE